MALKKKLTSYLFLTHYKPDLDIIVASDAISYSAGACILHKMADGKTDLIAHELIALHPAGKNIFKLKKRLWRLYLQSQYFTVLFMVDTLRYWLTTSHYSPFLVERKVSLLTQPTDGRDAVQSFLIIISKWSTYHRINLGMWKDYQG